ncbi:MAG TPA: group 1 truncated hemoglobin [Methanotrichaceae archaeon]|nr:group 1 truncated hemoglobin [Methanotrichaceae archaeon]
MAKASLYERVGGYNAIAAVVDSLMMRFGTDPQLAKYFAGHSEDSMKRLRQLQVDMICQAAGGPCFYLGRDMKTVHKGIGINGTEWQAAITHIIDVLDNFNVPDAEQKEVLTLLNSIKGDIVEKP